MVTYHFFVFVPGNQGGWSYTSKAFNSLVDAKDHMAVVVNTWPGWTQCKLFSPPLATGSTPGPHSIIWSH